MGIKNNWRSVGNNAHCMRLILTNVMQLLFWGFSQIFSTQSLCQLRFQPYKLAFVQFYQKIYTLPLISALVDEILAKQSLNFHVFLIIFNKKISQKKHFSLTVPFFFSISYILMLAIVFCQNPINVPTPGSTAGLFLKKNHFSRSDRL